MRDSVHGWAYLTNEMRGSMAPMDGSSVYVKAPLRVTGVMSSTWRERETDPGVEEMLGVKNSTCVGVRLCMHHKAPMHHRAPIHTQAINSARNNYSH